MCEKQALIDFDFMAIKLSKKFSCNNDFEDLYQIAKISIIEAVRNYDKKRGAKLSTHVFTVILFNLKNFSMKNNCLIYQPSYSDKKIQRIDLDQADLVNNLQDDYDKVENKIILQKAFSSLTPKQKQIIKLKYLDGYTSSEIAEILNCSHQNICKISSRAINTIQNSLNL